MQPCRKQSRLYYIELALRRHPANSTAQAGIISEMMDDAMDTDSEVLEEETEAEIDKVRAGMPASLQKATLVLPPQTCIPCESRSATLTETWLALHERLAVCICLVGPPFLPVVTPQL